MSRIPLPQENWRHLWSDLGKIKFSPSLVGQMTYLMSQMITRHKEFSNELSWAQFGFEEGIQKLTETALFLEAASFGTFWPVLGTLIFDSANEFQIEKFQLGWKVDSNIFPTSYPVPNLDTRKAFKKHLKVALRISLGTLRIRMDALHISGALCIRQHFSVQFYTCATHQGRTTCWVRCVTCWDFFPEIRQNALQLLFSSIKTQV